MKAGTVLTYRAPASSPPRLSPHRTWSAGGARQRGRNRSTYVSSAQRMCLGERQSNKPVSSAWLPPRSERGGRARGQPSACILFALARGAARYPCDPPLGPARAGPPAGLRACRALNPAAPRAHLVYFSFPPPLALLTFSLPTSLIHTTLPSSMRTVLLHADANSVGQNVAVTAGPTVPHKKKGPWSRNPRENEKTPCLQEW